MLLLRGRHLKQIKIKTGKHLLKWSRSDTQILEEEYRRNFGQIQQPEVCLWGEEEEERGRGREGDERGGAHNNILYIIY